MLGCLEEGISEACEADGNNCGPNCRACLTTGPGGKGVFIGHAPPPHLPRKRSLRAFNLYFVIHLIYRHFLYRLYYYYRGIIYILSQNPSIYINRVDVIRVERIREPTQPPPALSPGPRWTIIQLISCHFRPSQMSSTFYKAREAWHCPVKSLYL